MTVLALQVAASTDDSNHSSGTNDVGRAVTSGAITSGDLTNTLLQPGSHSGNNEYSAGARFTGVTIPQGATINSATFEMRANSTYNAGSNVIKYHVSAQASDNAPTFGTGAGENLRTANRPRTTAESANWTQTSVTGGTWYSISVTSVIQEIVNRAGWASGNAIVIIVDTHADTTLGEWQDYDSYNGGASLAPKLTIDYTAGGGGPTLITSTDTGAAAEGTPTVSTSVSGTDNPTVTENALLVTFVASADSSNLSDTQNAITGILSASDALLGTEATANLAVFVNPTDSGAGSEGSPGLLSSLTLTPDAITLTDAGALTAILSGADAAGLSDAQALLGLVSGSDSATSLEGTPGLIAFLTPSDSAGQTDGLALAAYLTASDTGQVSAESSSLNGAGGVSDTDAASFTEVLSLTTYINAAEAAAALEAALLTVLVSGSDTAGAGDAGSLTAHFSGSDAAGASEAGPGLLSLLIVPDAGLLSEALAIASTLSASDSLRAVDVGILQGAVTTLEDERVFCSTRANPLQISARPAAVYQAARPAYLFAATRPARCFVARHTI